MGCYQLKRLSLDVNHLTELPDFPISLEKISVQHNRLRYLPGPECVKMGSREANMQSQVYLGPIFNVLQCLYIQSRDLVQSLSCLMVSDSTGSLNQTTSYATVSLGTVCSRAL